MTLNDKAKILLEEISSAPDVAALEQKRIEALGRKGFVTAALRSLGELPQTERAQKGQLLNQIKQDISDAIAMQKKSLQLKTISAQLENEKSDITLPVMPGPVMRGRQHPIWQVIDEAGEIFSCLGFACEDGPDIETEYYNFTALNIPPNHPARQSHDTFFFPAASENADGDDLLCLRTHTSPVQIRVMEKTSPPFRFIAPGRVYRRDSDQTHTPMFHQIEGVAIDRDIHLGHLKWILLCFLRSFFENDAVEIRMRPHYFPFTEPSLEVDMRANKNAPWLEIAGCGMVHPHIFAACNINPDQWQGFAFGFGIDRLAMLKYGIDDLRSFFDMDLNWLKHYGFSPLARPSAGGADG